jgi:hypothetical protein
MRNKILAVFGIITYILSVLSSAQNLQGDYVASAALIVISAVAIVAFTIMAIIYLWQRSRMLSVLFILLTIIVLILTFAQELILPSYGSVVVILLNIFKMLKLVIFILVIIKLFKSN